MEQIKSLLKAREKQLLQIKEEKKQALTNVPKGFLRICNRGEKALYYQRTDPKDYNGIYIKEKDVHIAQELAQKDYDQKILRAAEKELSAINKYLSACPGINVEQVYEKLHKERQKLIIPIRETEEQYIREWESVEYRGKGFKEEMPDYYTVKGERVRSKSEMIIADLLNREGIPYRYEYPIHFTGIGNFCPDFTVLNIR